MRTTSRARRTVAVAVIATAVPVVLAGCAAPGNTDSANGKTITYWLWDSNQQPAYQQCADAFQASSGITVDIEQYGWADYWQGLTTGFASGTAPDVFADHLSYYPQFVSQGQLLDISDRVEKDGIDLGIYQDGLAELWTNQDGGRYGLRRTSTPSPPSTTRR